jgi:hypothetical protein
MIQPYFLAIVFLADFSCNGRKQGLHKAAAGSPAPGGNQEMLCLSEQGLYFFLGRSDKPLVLPFQKWIAGDVIPAIRKKGFYAVPGQDREEQNEWKRNFPYPFLLLENADRKLAAMTRAVDKGLMDAREWRRVVLGDFGPHKPAGDIVAFVRENLTITGNGADYVEVSRVYARYAEQDDPHYSRNTLVRKIKAAFPGITYKQKKLDGYPALIFQGCKLKNRQSAAALAGEALEDEREAEAQ